jgi:hypothetical protein
LNRRERRQQRSDTYKAGKAKERQQAINDSYYSKGIGVRFDWFNGEYLARGSVVTATAKHPKLQPIENAPKSQGAPIHKDSVKRKLHRKIAKRTKRTVEMDNAPKIAAYSGKYRGWAIPR